MVYIQIKSK